jgi:hypothetical protein
VLTHTRVDFVQLPQPLLGEGQAGGGLDGALKGGRQHRDGQRLTIGILQGPQNGSNSTSDIRNVSEGFDAVLTSCVRCHFCWAPQVTDRNCVDWDTNWAGGWLLIQIETLNAVILFTNG